MAKFGTGPDKKFLATVKVLILSKLAKLLRYLTCQPVVIKNKVIQINAICNICRDFTIEIVVR